MGTRFDLLLIGPGPAAAGRLWTGIAAELERLDGMLNRFEPASEVSRINAGASRAPVAVSPEMAEILRLCAAYYDSTERLFDVTLRDFSRVAFPAPRSVSFGGASLTLDFGGFAKGYALRKIGATLREAGARSAFADFGNSSILGIGRHPYGACWKVSLPNPCTQQTLDEFGLENRALSTSGNTARHNGHIVNPQTGVYDTELKLAAVAADDPLDAEVLSTVRMIAGSRQWERIARNFGNMQATLYTL